MRTEQEIREKIAEIRGFKPLPYDVPFGVVLEMEARALEWCLKLPLSPTGETWYCSVHQILDCEQCPKQGVSPAQREGRG